MFDRIRSFNACVLAVVLASACAKKAPERPCKELVDTFCMEVGKDTPSCESAKATFRFLSDRTCKTGIADLSLTKKKLTDAKICGNLMSEICARTGSDSSSCTVARERTDDLSGDKCAKLMQHVDAVVNELKQQEKAKLPLPAELQARIAANDAPSFGPTDARVTVVEFSDFQCPFCSKAAEVTRQLKAQYGERIRFVFRQFPLPFHKNAESAAEASLAAHVQGRFWDMHDKMFANQKRLDRDSLESYARELGLDVSKFKAALDTRESEARMRADAALASEAAVLGTPTLFVNGRRVNPSNVGEVIKSIESALASQ